MSLSLDASADQQTESTANKLFNSMILLENFFFCYLNMEKCQMHRKIYIPLKTSFFLYIFCDLIKLEKYPVPHPVQ